jgi:hypothetical protein
MRSAHRRGTACRVHRLDFGPAGTCSWKASFCLESASIGSSTAWVGRAKIRFAWAFPRTLLGCLIFTFLTSVVPHIPGQIYDWTTIAGNAGWGSTDGTNSDGRFWAPLRMAADQNGNLYVTDYRSDTIRKITPAGTNWVVSTLAGLPGSQGSTDGTNGAARFYSPVGIAVNSQGTIFVADCYNWRVVRSCRFFQSEDSGVAAADKADFGGEEFLERKAFG